MGHAKKLKLAVLLSGSGTTLENLFEHSASGAMPAEVVFVGASRPDAYGLKRAEKRGVPTAVVERKAYVLPEEYSDALFRAIEPYAPDLICLAGFMSLLKIPPAYAGKVINIHPALLPAFGGKGYYGMRVHEAVLRHGCKVSGCTVHMVDNEYDNGPILAQKAVPVKEDDTVETLAERVQAAEREIYPEAIRLIAEGRVHIGGRRTRIDA